MELAVLAMGTPEEAGLPCDSNRKLVTWSSKLETGVSVVDEQHMKLVDLVNQLSDAMYSGRGLEMLHYVMMALEGYALHHFHTEEKLMAAYQYKDTVAHKRSHDSFVKTVRHFRHKFEAGKVVVSAEILCFLREWIINHIMMDDREFGRSLGRFVSRSANMLRPT